ncbi:MAG: 4-hydroxy-tetrahydrodipicolinate synthase [Phycisphaeraceae bacterium]
MLQGTFTAIITPLKDDKVDFDRLEANVEYQIEQGIDGLVPVGTTGESPTLSHEEHQEVISRTVKAAAGRAKVIAGTGSNSTREALELTRFARDAGADAGLSVNPYYNKPTQEGLYRHFMTVADQVDLPMVLYNIPGRTGIALTAETVARLAEHDNIIGVKEATGELDMASEIAMMTNPQEFQILSGDDSLTLPIMAVGGHGVVSVLSNLLPARIKAMVDAALNDDFSQAREHHLQLFPLFRAMFLETNPIPIKTAMQLAGRDAGEFRLPLCEMAKENREQLEQVLREHGGI